MPNLGNTTRPAYVYDAETDTWCPIGVGAHTHDQIPASIVDAKGDLIVGTAADTVQRRSVGADGSYLVADSTQTTGLNWAGPSNIAGKNAIINGGFDIWQRGTSFTPTSSPWIYTTDRWAGVTSTGTATYAQETTVVPSGSRYSMKITAGATQIPYLAQEIETMNVLPFAGQTVTVSAKVAASASIPMSMVVQYSTNVDEPVINGQTTITATSGGTATPTSTTFVSISGVYAIPSTAKSIRVYFAPTSNMTSGQIIYIGQVQLEIGQSATPFSRAGGTIQGELAACQRYYQTAPELLTPPTSSGGFSGNAYNFQIFPVVMRVAPTITFSAHDGTSGAVSLYVGATPTKSTSVSGMIPYAWGYTGNFTNAAWGVTADGRLLVFKYNSSAEL